MLKTFIKPPLFVIINNYHYNLVMATFKRVDIFNIIMLSLSALCGVYLSMGDVLFGSDGFKNQSLYMSLGLLLILIAAPR